MKRLALVLFALSLYVHSSLAQELVFVTLADVHSAYDALPRVLTQVQAIADEYPDARVYTLINGDVFEPGNVVAARSGGEVEWAFLERLDAVAPVVLNLGNHEFDFSSPADFMARAEAAGLTVIGNIVSRDTGALVAPAVTTVEVDDFTIDIVGLAPNELNTFAQAVRASILVPAPGEWLEYYDAFTVLSDATLVMSHAGAVDDREALAALAPSPLIALGAHDHLVLESNIATPQGELLYIHGGAKAESLGLITLNLAGDGPQLRFDTVRVDDRIAADAALETLVRQVRAQQLTPEDEALIGTVPQNYSLTEAAAWAVETLRQALDADVALLNHTSFGSGLAAGPLAKYQFDEFLRFDNEVMVAEVDGETLQGILAIANQGPATPLEARTGDFVYATDVRPEAGQTYTIVTSSWVALPFNTEGYLGRSDITFEQVEGITTKGILADALR